MRLLTASKTLAETIKKIWPGPVKPNTTKKEVSKIMFLRKNALKATISLMVLHTVSSLIFPKGFFLKRAKNTVFFIYKIVGVSEQL
jgi:hypothetical protein